MNGKEFIKAVKLVTEEKGIKEDIIFEGMEQALVTAYKKNFKNKTNVKVTIDKKTGDIKVFAYYVVVEEYIDDGEKIRLSKKKITTKNVPPDMSAIKLLLMGTDSDYSKMSDEELEKEKERLIASIKELE